MPYRSLRTTSPELKQTGVLRSSRWVRGLPTLRAKAIAQARVEHPIGGNPGDVRPVGGGVSELQIKVALVTGPIYNNGDHR